MAILKIEKEYEVQSGNISAKVKITPKKGQYGHEIYVVKFEFTVPHVDRRGEEHRVEIKYSILSALYTSEIFKRIKRAEEGIEEIFCSGSSEDEIFHSDTSKDWRGQRHVMRCIMSLEDQVNGKTNLKPLYAGIPVDFGNLGRNFDD